MRNASTRYSSLFAVVIICLCMFFGCNKIPLNKRPFEVKTKTVYRVSPTAPVPLQINGINYTGFANFPGGGSGTASLLGNCSIFFNQLVYSTGAEQIPAGSIPAPVAHVPSYLVTGGPLPLIQAGDLTGISAAVSSLGIPAEINGKIINSVIMNTQGEAIFTAEIAGSGSAVPISATVLGFKGKALITGGRGKFKNASGEIDYTGYINTADPNDATYNATGWIVY